MAKRDPLLGEIAALLAGAEAADDPARIERTLTDGYARALALEAERRRLEQRVRALSLAVGRGDAVQRRELAQLVRDMERHEGELDELRGDLGRLRRRHSSAVRAQLV